MKRLHKAGVALLAGLTGLAFGGVAEADTQGGAPQGEAPHAEAPRQPEGKQGAKPESNKPESKQKGLGAGIGGQEKENQGQGTTFVLKPLDTGAACAACEGQGMTQGYGAGVTPGGETSPERVEPGHPGMSAAAPVPQFWLADASLFLANASNAAQTLANEQTLGVQSPSVLGNQAQFLLASTERALSSLKALHASAEVTHPHALPDIRSAMDQLTAAKGQAQQALDAANNGTLGPGEKGAIRSTYEHLQAAEKDVQGVGRAFGAQEFMLAKACAFRGRAAMGAGIGGAKGTAQPPAKAAPAPQKPGTPEKPGTAAPEKSPTPAPEPAPGTEKP